MVGANLDGLPIIKQKRSAQWLGHQVKRPNLNRWLLCFKDIRRAFEAFWRIAGSLLFLDMDADSIFVLFHFMQVVLPGQSME